ncbi:protein eva-1 homolog C-like isoform X2 [Hemicordylus capensis]|uniref:protein eva-1 homolog C-like isoform X2 n=1 Tax=Hemicordylus capensis TaxID=884348 RepID=UPI002304B616|nr:protein eva-1 homolog C-like isoform X2 [Hemicordylus capensis]
MPGSHWTSYFLVFGTVFFCFSAFLRAAPEFSGYLQKVLKNHTAHACDGEQLTVICPHKTSISILSAFYGRRVPSQNLCPSSGDLMLEDTDCVSATARQKMMDECQDQRWCHFSVHSHVFGPDPCPGTHKYLVVSYKCRPANHRLKTVCENEKLRMQCRNKSVLAIYSAIYGRPLWGKPECDSVNRTGPDIECLAPDALRRVSRRCHRKRNCTIVADSTTFGDPCFPGVRKQLRVSYTCVPRQLLEEVSRESQEDPFSITDYTHGVPEKVGFYFLCGVSGGLMFLLLLFAPKVAFLQDLKAAFKATELSNSLELETAKLHVKPDEDNHDDSSSESSFCHLTRTYHNSNNIFGPELTAALEGAADQRGHEGDEIWIPKESSPYAIHKIKSATK